MLSPRPRNRFKGLSRTGFSLSGFAICGGLENRQAEARPTKTLKAQNANREIGVPMVSTDPAMLGSNLSDGARAVAFFLTAEAKGLMQRLHGFFHSA